jgi:hypothetical protein
LTKDAFLDFLVPRRDGSDESEVGSPSGLRTAPTTVGDNHAPKFKREVPCLIDDRVAAEQCSHIRGLLFLTLWIESLDGA